jgi:hypothetical protein
VKPALLLLLLWPTPARAAADRYDEPPPRATAPVPPLVARIDQLVARLASQSRRPVPLRDPRLDAAADEIARIVPDRAPPPNELVQGALWLHGIVEPPPQLLLTTMGAQNEDELLARLAADLPAVLGQGRYARIGVGLQPLGQGETRVLVALQESFVNIRSLPRSLPIGARVDLSGSLRDDFVNPEAFVTAPDGKVLTRMALHGRASAFGGSFKCGPEPGRYQVEITGDDRFGATVLANFPLWCGQPAPRTLREVAPPGGHDEESATPQAAERTAFKLLNADRARAGLLPLGWDESLANVARGHSLDMMAHDFFGHISPSTGSAQDRVRKAGLDTQLLLENVARAFTAGESERGLMSSPGHRANILNAEVSRVGIGVAIEKESHELLVTQLFSLPPEQFGAHSSDDVRRQMDELRRARKKPPLVHEPAFDELAQSMAARLASGKLTSSNVSKQIGETIASQSDRWREVRSVVAVVGSPSQVVPMAKEPLVDEAITHVGLGIERGPRREGGHGLYVVIILVTKR